MNLLLCGTFIYLLIGLLILVVPNNALRAKIGVASQFLGTTFILVAILPILLTGTVYKTKFEWSYPIGDISLVIDPLDAFFLLFSLPMTALGALYAYGYMKPYFHKKRHLGIHFLLLNLTSISFVMIYSLQNSMAFFFGWELAAVSAWLLVIWEHGNQKIRFAGFNYLVSTHISLIFLIAAFMVIYAHTGSFDFTTFSDFLAKNSLSRNITFLLLITSFGLKSAFFPFHTWLPRAHSAAPAHVSALMSGVIHKAGLYGLLRFTMLIGRPPEWMGWFLIIFSLASAFFGVIYTVTQRDLKRLLGYSSTENVGIAGVGFGIGYLGLAWDRPELICLGFSGGLLHVINHAFFKCLLFYAAGSIYRMAHTIDIEKMGGLIRKMPLTAIFFLCGSIAIAGLPPFNGFVSEFLIYNGLFSGVSHAILESSWLLVVASMMAFIGAISAFSMIRSFGIAFLGNPRDPHSIADADPPLSMKISMALHTIGVILLGVFPAMSLYLLKKPVLFFLPIPDTENLLSNSFREPIDFISFLALIIIFVTLAILVLRFALVGRTKIKSATWGCGYRATNPRMQYTGSSFSDSFAIFFRNILKFKNRKELPKELFPKHSFINTHCIDSVESRIFRVLGEGEQSLVKLVTYLREEFNTSFAFGLVFLTFVVGFLIWVAV